MNSNERYALRLEITKKYNEAGIYDVDAFIIELVNKIADGANINIDGLLLIDNRINNLQDRLGFNLPEDYIKFLRKHSGSVAGYGEWFTIENINFAYEFDIINYYIVENNPELLSEDDLQYMIPIYSENDSYVLLDLRTDENSKGVFVIWSDEEELAFKSKTFTEFKKKAKAHAKKAENAGDELIECDFFNFDVE
jgi:hypothetical protein